MNISIFNSIKFKNISLLLILSVGLLSGCSNEIELDNSSSNKASKPLLRAEEAFKYQIEDTGAAIKINWSIEDGYYLYRKKMNFVSNSPDIQLVNLKLPEGSYHEDEFFGVQQVYRGNTSFHIPYKRINTPVNEFELQIESQGCADRGICYPPQKWTTNIKLTKSSKLTQSDPLNILNDQNYSAINLAFKPFLRSIDSSTLEIAFQIAPNHYLYKDKISITAKNKDIKIGAIELPKGEIKTDEWFGETEVYFKEVFGRIAIGRVDPNETNLTFLVNYQGCIEDELCLPPQQKEIDVIFPPGEITSNTNVISTEIKISEQSRLASLVSQANIITVILTFFVAGLLLSLTPCCLPMIPILSGILAGEGEHITPRRGFILAASYVMGMAIVYTLAGIISASIGLQLQALFNTPWVIIVFVILFVFLALAMFDLVNIELPSIFQTQLSKLNNQQRRGTVIGSFFIGAISSLIVTACVAPPLVATLMVISQTGDVARGGIALFAMSLGMGTPLIILGTSAGRLLPKAGEWMNKVKNIFGFLMLGLAIYMLSRVINATIILALWGILALMFGVFIGGLNSLTENSKNTEKFNKALGLLVLVYGIALILGSLSGSKNPMQPLANIGIFNQGNTTNNELHFKRIKSIEDLDYELTLAASQKKSVMLDFYADWCVSCKEMEAYTFVDRDVQTALSNTVLLQADVTANDNIDQTLLNKLNVFGPPTIIFYDNNGFKRDGYEVVGYMKAREFAAHTQAALK